MAWAIVNRAEDGRHVKSYATQAIASQAFRDLVGVRDDLRGNIEDGKEVVDEWGRVVYIKKLPKGVTGKQFAAFLDAYDARECGTLTPAQEEILAKWPEAA